MAVPLIALSASTLAIIYRFIIQPVFVSPLRKIPKAHWSASFSSLWILNERGHHRETFTVHAAHQKHGPIIRLAPNEISVNSVDGGIRTVYAGGYEKGDWYINGFNNYGIRPMFAMPDSRTHSKRKRMISNIYAKSTLQTSSGVAEISRVLVDDRLIPVLRARAKAGRDIELYTVFQAVTMDFVMAYMFGLPHCDDFTRDETFGWEVFTLFRSRQPYTFWNQETPVLVGLLGKLGLRSLLIPEWVDQANRDFEKWLLEKCEKSEKVMQKMEKAEEAPSPEDFPNVYAQLRQAMIKDHSANAQAAAKQKTLEKSADAVVQEKKLPMASEFLDHVLAGFDTSSIVLTFLAWELSKPENSKWQAQLRKEVTEVANRHDAKLIDALPTLHAVLMETLRLHASIPGNQPRITPPGATLGAPGHVVEGIPANVRVQAQAWSLHREASVFPDPESWRPERWLDASPEQAKEMARWFWAFGSGGRMCVGSNLAMLDMKAIIAAVWSQFQTSVVNADGMVHAGGYSAEPVGKDGKYCVLRLQELVV